VADHLVDGPSAHQRNIAAPAVIAWKAETVRVDRPARVAQKVVVKEVERFDVEYFLKAHHVRIGMSENRRRQASIGQVQCSSLQSIVLGRVVVPGAIKPRTSHRVTEAKVLDVESCDAHASQMGGSVLFPRVVIKKEIFSAPLL